MATEFDHGDSWEDFKRFLYDIDPTILQILAVGSFSILTGEVHGTIKGLCPLQVTGVEVRM